MFEEHRRAETSGGNKCPLFSLCTQSMVWALCNTNHSSTTLGQRRMMATWVLFPWQTEMSGHQESRELVFWQPVILRIYETSTNESRLLFPGKWGFNIKKNGKELVAKSRRHDPWRLVGTAIYFLPAQFTRLHTKNKRPAIECFFPFCRVFTKFSSLAQGERKGKMRKWWREIEQMQKFLAACSEPIFRLFTYYWRGRPYFVGIEESCVCVSRGEGGSLLLSGTF